MSDNDFQLAFAGDLDADVDVRHVEIVEPMSDLFRVDATIVSPDPNIDLDALVGRGAAFRIGSFDPAAPSRVWAGVVAAMALTGDAPAGLSEYQVVLVPTLWRATLRRNCRSFQGLSTPEIVKKVLGEWDIRGDFSGLTREHRKHDYRVQYSETDYAFISRLLEDAGISFFFVNAAPSGQGADITKLTFSDAFENRAQREKPLAYRGHDAPKFGAPDFASNVRIVQEVRPGRVTLRDHDFTLPFAKQPEAKTPALEGRGASQAAYEIYDHAPGGLFFQIGDRAADPPSHDHGQNGALVDEDAQVAVAKERLAAARSGDLGVSFQTNALDLGPGAIVAVNQGSDETPDHPHHYLRAEGDADADDGSPKLLVTSVTFRGYASSDSWTMTATACFAKNAYRPPRVTPKPRILGVQSALVVGPPGKEIHTDEHGRVRVQFHWDREGKYDDDSSCWIRVSQPSAGGQYGFFALPRVGHEVLVSFLDGDPDRPVVTGRVYNGATKQAVKLPAEGAISYWRSDGSPGGGGYNEIRFDDTQGKEVFQVQAQRDLSCVVKNAQRTDVGKTRQAKVGGRDRVHVGKEQHLVVGKAYTTNAGKGARLRVGPTTELHMMDEAIVLTTGDASLSLWNNGIVLKAKGQIDVHAAKGLDVSSSGPVAVASGTKVILQGGPKVDMNPPGAPGPNAVKVRAPKEKTRHPAAPKPGVKSGAPFVPQAPGLEVPLPQGITDIQLSVELDAPEGSSPDGGEAQ